VSRASAIAALQASDTTPDGAFTRDQLLTIALVHAVLALSEKPAPATQPAAPADRVLYRDNVGDLWMCGPDGMPYVVDPDIDHRQRGNVWCGGPGTLAEVERDHGPLHVVPWPGEVR
jgi:hypothetical protein